MAETVSSGSGCSTPLAVTGSFEVDQCKICFNDFDTDRHTPKLLGCSHTFCLECLEKIGLHSAENRGWRIGCPVCCHQTPLQENDIRRLPDNTAVVDLLPLVEHQHEDTLGSRPTSPPHSPTMIHEDVQCNEVYRCAFVTCLVLTILSFLSMTVFLFMGIMLVQEEGFAVLFGELSLILGGFCALVGLMQSGLLYLLKRRSRYFIVFFILTVLVGFLSFLPIYRLLAM